MRSGGCVLNHRLANGSIFSEASEVATTQPQILDDRTITSCAMTATLPARLNLQRFFHTLKRIISLPCSVSPGHIVRQKRTKRLGTCSVAGVVRLSIVDCENSDGREGCCFGSLPFHGPFCRSLARASCHLDTVSLDAVLFPSDGIQNEMAAMCIAIWYFVCAD